MIDEVFAGSTEQQRQPTITATLHHDVTPTDAMKQNQSFTMKGWLKVNC